MNENSSILVIIPARGGSKGIPRKNLRPLNGLPLIQYSIRNAMKSKYRPVVCVSSDDREILDFAESLGALAVARPAELGADAVTLDPVIFHAVNEMERREGRLFDFVVTMQPTSPLLAPESLDSAIGGMIADGAIDTVISAREDTHLSWRKESGGFRPNYAKRVNRQQLPAEYRETGGFFISRRNVVKESGRIGENVSLFLVRGPEAIDIDGYDDWALCEFYLSRKKVLFVVSGYREIGLGHVYNTLLIAHEILDHEVGFLVDRKSAMAYERIKASNYPVRMQESDDIVDDIKAMGPNVVINDRLDTGAEYVKALKAAGFLVINFEDLGPGIEYADLVVNAIYPEKELRPNHYFGPSYFALRDDFLRIAAKEVSPEVREVLVTFGGVDPNDYTRKTLEAIHGYCVSRGIAIKVVTGFGYDGWKGLEGFVGVEILRNVANMAMRIGSADIAFISAGRTTYEVAAMGTPAIVMAQNEREMTHFFAGQEYGFLNLGLGYELDRERIEKEFIRLVEDYPLRRHMSALMLSNDLRGSKKKLMKLIKGTMGE